MKETISYIHASYTMAKYSLGELEQLSRIMRDAKFRATYTRFYKYNHIAQMYCFVNEYCKLFDEPRGTKNIASLLRLVKDGEIFHSEIINVRESEFYKIVKVFRDTSFSHSDMDSEPYRKKFLSDKQIAHANEHLSIVHTIIQEKSDVHFSINEYDQSTTLLFTNYLKYKDFYFKHI